jgi:hypothetical protein
MAALERTSEPGAVEDSERNSAQQVSMTPEFLRQVGHATIRAGNFRIREIKKDEEDNPKEVEEVVLEPRQEEVLRYPPIQIQLSKDDSFIGSYLNMNSQNPPDQPPNP